VCLCARALARVPFTRQATRASTHASTRARTHTHTHKTHTKKARKAANVCHEDSQNVFSKMYVCVFLCARARANSCVTAHRKMRREYSIAQWGVGAALGCKTRPRGHGVSVHVCVCVCVFAHVSMCVCVHVYECVFAHSSLGRRCVCERERERERERVSVQVCVYANVFICAYSAFGSGKRYPCLATH